MTCRKNKVSFNSFIYIAKRINLMKNNYKKINHFLVQFSEKKAHFHFHTFLFVLFSIYRYNRLPHRNKSRHGLGSYSGVLKKVKNTWNNMCSNTETTELCQSLVRVRRLASRQHPSVSYRIRCYTCLLHKLQIFVQLCHTAIII